MVHSRGGPFRVLVRERPDDGGVAPAEVRMRLQIAAEAASIHPSVFSQHLALAYLQRTDWQSVLREGIARYEAC
jgi:DNA-binding transcriptional MocR family regulator